MLKQSLRILGLDLGEKYIGCAFYSEKTGILSLPPINTVNKHLIIKLIEQTISDYDANRVVVGDMGLPKLATFWEKVCRHLEKKSLEIEVIEERFTSVQANQDAVQSGIKSRDARVHSLAAEGILRTYLDK